ncbi:MAG: exopolysaccharide biosynthesis polyprenyl glycosylphosphotransferase [Deltaproteobacteria bacterium]|nr:exopolysaccharide biosynthesis polyprenyl glycosylphosphotransferase [Deltaproteobacteria bacterium]
MVDTLNNHRQNQDEKSVPGVRGGENMLLFKPFLTGPESVSVKRKLSSLSGYKVALLAGDFIAAFAGFFIGLWLTAGSVLYDEAPGPIIGFFILSLATIAFFRPNHLYSYHFLYTRKKHLANLGKSFCWSLLTLGIILFLYSSPMLLEKHFSVFMGALLVGAVAFIFLSRLLSDHLLDFLLAIGLSFLIVGMTGLFFEEEIPAFMTNGVVIGICFFTAVVLLTASRIFLFDVAFNKWLRRRFRRQVLIAGADQEASKIASHIVDQNAPFWVVGTIGPEGRCGLKSDLGKVCLGDYQKIPAIAGQFKIEDIIITDETIDRQALVSLLDYCTSAGIDAWFSPRLMPIIDVKLYIDNFCGLPMIRLCSQKNTWLFSKVKQGFDALITVPLFILQLPLFLLISLAIKLDSPGSVFYKATAIGKNGKIFSMYKFRSMRTDTDSDVHKQFVTKLIKGEIGKEEDDEKPLKITDDPRITRVGNILRKLSLDELPQLINVLKGEMSLVGPRPCLPYEYEVYEEWYKKRAAVRAGITGLWQVTGRSSVSFEDMILLDLYYIYNRDLSLDLNILFETIFVVLGKKGAF